MNGKKALRALFDIVQDILIAPISILYYLAGKYALAKTLVASDECTNCKLCYNICPVNAIKIVDNRMFWSHKCESCMKCVNSCPKKAIQTNLTIWGLVFYLLVVLVIFSVAKLMKFAGLEILEQNDLVSFIASVIAIPLYFVYYRFQHYLMRYKFFNKVITYSSFSSYKFWGRYKAPKPDINLIKRLKKQQNA